MSYNYKTIVNNPKERSMLIYPWCYWDDVFTEEELDQMCDYFSKHGVERGKTQGQDEKDVANLEIEISKSSESNSSELIFPRKSMVKFHNYSKDTAWFFDKLNWAIEQINTRFYNFDLNGYDAVQYTEYYDYEQGKYDFHMDTFMTNPIENEMRKLSITMLLNEPEIDFEGGGFEINQHKETDAIKVDTKRGRIIAFPSFMLHRVAPVTKGTRKSLVVWVLGPKFK
jgi:PKHD-type hydroxylase